MERPDMETYSMADIKKTDNQKKIPWVQLVERKDPTIYTRPVATYVFNDGNRVFYKPRKK